MANKKVELANKLVTKATTVFGDAVSQVEKANELLRRDIATDLNRNELDKAQIEQLQEQIDFRNSEVDEKKEQIKKNDELIAQLKAFVPQQ